MGIKFTIYNEMFEDLCSEFKQDTGYLAPSKDSPSASNNSNAYETERNIAWKAWFKGRERGLNFPKKQFEQLN